MRVYIPAAATVVTAPILKLWGEYLLPPIVVGDIELCLVQLGYGAFVEK